MLYDEYAAVVLGFLEKLTGDKSKSEELLQAVFLALPAKLHEYDGQKGRFVPWLLKLAVTTAGQGQNSADSKTNGNNGSTNHPIREEVKNVDSTANYASRTLSSGTELSAVELIYVKGYTFAQAAAEFGVDERSVQLLVRKELKKYRL